MKDKIVAPDHIANYCIGSKEGDLVLERLKQEYEDNLSYVYKIKCECGNEKFIAYKDDMPTVIAKCPKCMRTITIYDLERYPSACSLSKSHSFKQVMNREVELYVNYEYSDDYIQDGFEFNPNDITWAKVFAVDNNECSMILNDETA